MKYTRQLVSLAVAGLLPFADCFIGQQTTSEIVRLRGPYLLLNTFA